MDDTQNADQFRTQHLVDDQIRTLDQAPPTGAEAVILSAGVGKFT